MLNPDKFTKAFFNKTKTFFDSFGGLPKN